MFGYMDLLIIGKWILVDASQAQCAPSILLSQLLTYYRTIAHTSQSDMITALVV